ncbi:MAG: hypothetical protein N3D71_04210 [Burkholderiaceae bacterium]|nr:hypothetical protein [Burkholderiaceae bacterium]
MPAMSVDPNALGVPSAASADPLDVALERTRRGQAELEKPQLNLSGPQRRLLAAFNGARTLREILAADPGVDAIRAPRNAARLVAFGLAKEVRGQLPQQLVVSALNLTMRIPLDALRMQVQQQEAAAERQRPSAARRAWQRWRRPLAVALAVAAGFAMLLWHREWAARVEELAALLRSAL